MVDVLLFERNNIETEKKRDERIESFGKTLNKAYKQYQKLWEDYNELFEKCKGFENNSSNIKKIAKDTNVKCCTCVISMKENMIPEDESACMSKEKKVKCDSVTPAINNEPKETSTPENSRSFQIFSQDFCTQGLEESFVKQNKTRLQEIQNMNLTRAKSPVFGSKKGKTRAPSSIIDSPNLSEKSVVILSDFGSGKNSIENNRSISNSDRMTSLAGSMSPIQISSPAPEAAVTPTSKNIKKWGISTIQNVNTDIIVGTNRKLKQSKMFVKTEKVTDLSTCDDVRPNESGDRDQVSETRAVINTNNFLEDSVIQGSPEQEKSSTKIRQRVARRNKSAQNLQPIFNNDGNTAMKRVAIHESATNDVGQTDTDVTVFDPKIASTQYFDLPCYSKSLRFEKSPVKDKPNLLERIHLRKEGGNDSNVIDETMFVEDPISADRQSQKKLSRGKIEKKKLSLRKIFTAYRNEGISNDKETSGAKVDINLEELKTASPPRKKIALADFDVLPRKKNTSPTYAYKGSPVRKQSERALLRGWSCLECQEYYEAMGLSEEDLQKRKNQCSRHRSKFNEKKVSQKDYWNPDFSSSYHSTMWSDS